MRENLYGQHKIMSVRSFLVGVVAASIVWLLAFTSFNLYTVVPNSKLEPRYEVAEAAVTENQKIFDKQSQRIILWTPGNPKNLVTDVREISDGNWNVTIEKIY